MRLREAVADGAEPRTCGVPVQRLSAGRDRPGGRRRLEGEGPRHVPRRRPVVPADRAQPADRDRRVRQQAAVRGLPADTERGPAVLLRAFRRAARTLGLQVRLGVARARRRAARRVARLGTLVGRHPQETTRRVHQRSVSAWRRVTARTHCRGGRGV